MATATHLIDNSALGRLRTKPSVAARLEPLILQGLAATCSITDLEQLFSARSGTEHREWRADIQLRFGHVPIDQRTLERAVEVQGLLADRAQHPAPTSPTWWSRQQPSRRG